MDEKEIKKKIHKLDLRIYWYMENSVLNMTDKQQKEYISEMIKKRKELESLL